MAMFLSSPVDGRRWDDQARWDYGTVRGGVPVVPAEAGVPLSSNAATSTMNASVTERAAGRNDKGFTGGRAIQRELPRHLRGRQ